MAERPQFTGVAPAGLIKQVFVDAGQPGGREIPGGLGLLSNAPISRVPTTPHGPTIGAFSEMISPAVEAALARGPEERAERVRAVVARKR